jgi:XTP/dITP diphosphohydrolase
MNMEILFGTSNPAKLAAMRKAVVPLGIKIAGLKDMNRPVPAIEENGADPLENAQIKATAFYRTFHMPVFSCDSGLYFEGIEDSLQPGTHVRRVNGKELTDEEMIDYYSKLALKYNGRLVGRYINAICLILDEEHIYCSMDESLGTEPFLLVGTPHEKRVPGFPLDALSVDLKTNKYYYDLPDRTVAESDVDGFVDFFIKSLNC